MDYMTTTYSHSGIGTTIDGDTVTITRGQHTSEGYVPSETHRVRVTTQRLAPQTVASELSHDFARTGDIRTACREIEERHSLTRGQLRDTLMVLFAGR